MVSAATLDELAGYAERGRIGSVVDLRCNNLYPEAETQVVLEWENEAEGVLDIEGIGRFAVPAVGQRRIEVGAEQILARLTAEGDSAEILLQPRIFVPSAQLRVSERIVLGAASRIAWHSDAETCTLRLTDSEGTQEQSVGPAGGIDFSPKQLGDLLIELVAVGRHAHLSPLVGIATERQTIQVMAPPVTISLDASKRTALIGDEASFSWNVTGTRAIRIDALERNESFPAAPVGTLLVEVGSSPERFRLVATSLDGIGQVAEFRLFPRLPDVASVSIDLDALNLPWE